MRIDRLTRYLTKLDDVKVVNDILSCEVGKRDLTFHRSSVK